MAWRLRFWRRVRVLPGVSVNLSKSGPSVSLGPRGSKVTIGRKGMRQTVGLTGTGLFATNYEPWTTVKPHLDEGADTAPSAVASGSDGTASAATPDESVRCDFCGAPASRGERCPMCNQPV